METAVHYTERHRRLVQTVVDGLRQETDKAGMAGIKQNARFLYDADLLKTIKHHILIAAAHAQQISDEEMRRDIEFALGAFLHDESIDYRINRAEGC